MFRLLKTEDKNLIENSNFAKNAVFYKDMLAFYEAYSLLQDKKDSLPNFCFMPDGNLCLEGLCLLMKMYATEFKFETIKLSLSYLKILYYVIASYAKADEVDREVIIAEFDKFREASFDFCKNKKEELLKSQKQLAASEKLILEKDKKCRKMQRNSKSSKAIAIVLLVFATLGILGCCLLALNFTMSSMWFVIAALGDVFAFVVSIVLFATSNSLKNRESDLSAHLQNLRKKLPTERSEAYELETKYNRVYCERYEYDACFSEVISRFTKVIGIDEILEKSRAYKLLSYNIAYDIGRLFRSQQKEIEGIISEIEGINLAKNTSDEFERIYLKIKEQDWLYYNAQLRYHFLKKFCDISEKELSWKLSVGDRKINPFDVDIKALTREKIAFSPSNELKLINTNLSDFSKTKYYKKLDDLSFKNGYSVDELKRVKSSYLERFYNAEVFEDWGEVSLSKRGGHKIINKNLEIEKGQKIPTLIDLKLKLIENGSGLGNSDAKVIKSISKSIFKDDAIEENIVGNIKEEDIDYPKFAASEIQSVNDAIVYRVGDKKIIGYKVDVE